MTTHAATNIKVNVTSFLEGIACGIKIGSTESLKLLNRLGSMPERMLPAASFPPGCNCLKLGAFDVPSVASVRTCTTHPVLLFVVLAAIGLVVSGWKVKVKVGRRTSDLVVLTGSVLQTWSSQGHGARTAKRTISRTHLVLTATPRISS